MQAVVALTGRGGWPLSVFLTPAGEPFYGGTYFPPERRHNMPAFREVLLSVAELWQRDRAQLLEHSQKLSQHLQRTAALPSEASTPLSLEILQEASQRLAQAYDWQNGGWGRAPKFPQPMTIEFLLTQATRGDRTALDMAVHALKAMARGGMYDVVGGGFARYSVDNAWRVPHFEKMLYDNAQLARAYLHAHLLTGEPAFRRVCEETLDFILRELSHPQGGFYASLDADSEGEEGKFYLWTPAEIRAALSNEEDARFVIAAYGISEAGNFEGRNVLQRVLDDAQLASRFGLQEDEIPARLRALHTRLRGARETRPRPATDDKALLAWNALTLSAFAEAGRYLRREDYLAAAQRNAEFLLRHMRGDDGRLLRSWRAGRAQHNAYLEDYAALILALLALYQSDPQTRWFAAARQLTEAMLSRFSDPQGGFFDTPHDHKSLLLRPKDLQDNATPSGNALAVTALLHMAAFEPSSDWREAAEPLLEQMSAAMLRYPTAFAQWLCAADFALGPAHEVALLTAPHDPETDAFIKALWTTYRPRLVAAIALYPPDAEAAELLHDRTLVEARTTAYVCQGFICLPPVNTAAEMEKQLKG